LDIDVFALWGAIVTLLGFAMVAAAHLSSNRKALAVVRSTENVESPWFSFASVGR
jgi:demethoxyubiquinone hydroxylase (CLK1/Coq7/Cat5 family)